MIEYFKNMKILEWFFEPLYIKTQTGNHIKTVHSDRGGEFLSAEFINHQDTKGTVRQLTIHDSP